MLKWSSAIILLIFAACARSYPADNSHHSSDQDKSALPFQIPRLSVENLLAQYSKDAQIVKDKYVGRKIEICGKIGFTNPPILDGRLYMRLTASAPTVHGVDCYVANDSEETFMKLIAMHNTRAVLRGIFRGGGPNFFVLEDSTIVQIISKLPSDAPTAYVPVVETLTNDPHTNNRIIWLLRLNGIECINCSMLTTTVAVDSRDVERARLIIRQALKDDGLRAFVIDE